MASSKGHPNRRKGANSPNGNKPPLVISPRDLAIRVTNAAELSGLLSSSRLGMPVIKCPSRAAPVVYRKQLPFCWRKPKCCLRPDHQLGIWGFGQLCGRYGTDAGRAWHGPISLPVQSPAERDAPVSRLPWLCSAGWRSNPAMPTRANGMAMKINRQSSAPTRQKDGAKAKASARRSAHKAQTTRSLQQPRCAENE